VITTALDSGPAAPKLIKEATVKAMKPGRSSSTSAVEQGGNVRASTRAGSRNEGRREADRLENLPRAVPFDALGAVRQKPFNFSHLMLNPKDGELKLDRSEKSSPAALLRRRTDREKG